MKLMISYQFCPPTQTWHVPRFQLHAAEEMLSPSSTSTCCRRNRCCTPSRSNCYALVSRRHPKHQHRTTRTHLRFLDLRYLIIHPPQHLELAKYIYHKLTTHTTPSPLLTQTLTNPTEPL